MKISRERYASLYGPTAGDRIRLADTELIIEIEKDFAIHGEEVQFGGGKVIRDSQGQSPLPGKSKEPPLDASASVLKSTRQRTKRGSRGSRM